MRLLSCGGDRRQKRLRCDRDAGQHEVRVHRSVRREMPGQLPHAASRQQQFGIRADVRLHPTDEFADRSDRTPEQTAVHRRLGRCTHDGGRVVPLGRLQQRQQIGAGRQGLADICSPGKIAPPRKSPSRETASTVIADPASTTIAGRPGDLIRAAAVAPASRSGPTRCGWSTRTCSGKSVWRNGYTLHTFDCWRNQCSICAATRRCTLDR